MCDLRSKAAPGSSLPGCYAKSLNDLGPKPGDINGWEVPVNLGRFGTHHMLITPAGCTGRLGSLVTEADLGEHPLIETREACLLKAGKACGLCIEACPVAALRTNGFERRRCWGRLKENRAGIDSFSDLPETTHVCGKCAAMMPCSFGNPVARLEAATKNPTGPAARSTPSS